MEKNNKIVVGISIGDLNGIGTEIVLKTFSDTRMFDFCTPVIFASFKTIMFIKKQLNIDAKLHGIDNLDKIAPNKINVLNVWKEPVSINFGTEDPKIGQYAIRSLKSSVEALKSNKVDVLVTAPINKSSIQSDSFKFPGHTDYLEQELEGKSMMLMVSETLKVGLLTDHVPVKKVPETITKQRILEKITTIHRALKQDFGIQKPKIAVLGINPHNGDKGVIGNEDDTVLSPTLKTLRDKGILAYGPYAADSFFGSHNYKNFDVVIASYHDQGLIPFKTLAFGSGVNYTAGLDKIRTSPDHGTAFDVAGKNCANPDSFKEAVFKALSIFKKRKEYLELTDNPLQIQQKKIQPKKK